MQAKKPSYKGKYTNDDESDELSDSNGSALVARCAKNEEREMSMFNKPQKTKVTRTEESVCEHFRSNILRCICNEQLEFYAVVF